VNDSLDEITSTLARLQYEIEDLAVGGLRAVGPERVRVLGATRDDLARVGAHHLATRLEALIRAIELDDREAAAALMRTQASLRVFERLLTLEATVATLEAQTPAAGEEGSGP
jgi:hypothetical protein